MSHWSEIDRSTLDYRTLTQEQRNAVVRRVVQEARIARAMKIRGLAQLAWHAAVRGGRAARAAIVAAWRAYQARRRRRATAVQLYAMDDRSLKDIGVRRGEIDFILSGEVDTTRHSRLASRLRGHSGTAARIVPERRAA